LASAASSYRDAHSDATSGRVLLFMALLLTAFAYVATVRFDFVYDDIAQIVSNPTLNSWSTLPTFFTGHSWKFLMPDWAGNYYRPLFMSWLLVNRKLFGVNPLAFHATTILVHLIVTWLCFVVARQLLRSGTYAGYTAVLFGLHPIHVEAVAWVSGVTEPLMAAFVLAAFWAWIKSEREPQRAALFKVLAAVFYAAGCLCKETALFLPVVVVAHDLLRGQFERNVRGMWRAMRNAVPLWTTALAYLIARALSLRGLVHPQPTPLARVLMTIPTILWGYMRRLVWPMPLTIFYDTPPVTSPLQIRFWLPLVGLVLAAIVAWRIGKRSRLTGLALVWIFAFLAPAIVGLPAFALGEWIHDRYLYLPSFGFCLLLVHAITQLPSKRDLFGLPDTPTALVASLAMVMAAGTAYQEQYWRTDFMLYARSAQISPNNAWANSHLANEFFRQRDFAAADRLYQDALRLDPTNWRNRIAYGLMLFYSQQYERADQALAASISLSATDPNQYFYQGMSRFNLGRFAAAEQAFTLAIHYGPRNARYHFWLGFSLERLGQLDEAESEYRKELDLHADTDTPARQRLEALLK
jgi:protein O-mannosyl-transferase